MAEHDEMSQVGQSENGLNPSGNPGSEIVRSESEFSRKTGNSELLNKVEERELLIKNELIDGNLQKNIVRLRMSESKSKSSDPNQLLSSSGGVSAKTQFIFNKVVMNNKNIKEKLMLLQKVGISNESNSLFKQII